MYIYSIKLKAVVLRKYNKLLNFSQSVYEQLHSKCFHRIAIDTELLLFFFFFSCIIHRERHEKVLSLDTIAV